MTPARVSDFSRLESRAGDILGTPRRRSLKCLLPKSISRTMSRVQRSSSTSMALAIGQNWPYDDIVYLPVGSSITRLSAGVGQYRFCIGAGSDPALSTGRG